MGITKILSAFIVITGKQHYLGVQQFRSCSYYKLFVLGNSASGTLFCSPNLDVL